MNTRLVIVTLVFGGVVASLYGFAFGPFLTVIADDIDSTVPLVGQAATASLIAGAVVGLVLGPMGDHYGLRRLLVGAALLLAVASVGNALVINYWSLVLTRIPGGIAAGLILGLGKGVINSRIPEEQRRGAITWTVSAGALAAIFGVPILALIAEHLSWRVGFLLIGFFGLVLLLANLRLVSPDPPVPDEPLRVSGIFGTYRRILGDARMSSLQLGNLLWALAWMGTLTYLGAYLMQEMGVSVSMVGYIFMMGGACFFLGNRSAAWLTNVWSPQSVMVLTGLVLGMTAIFVFSVSANMMATAIAVALMCGVCGIGVPVITILISETATGTHGTVMMLRQFTWSTGAALGAASGGLLLILGGFGALGVGFAAVAILAISSIVLAIRPMPISNRKLATSRD
jgi:MFS transporter, DHA1 family, inner membrane transport protein